MIYTFAEAWLAIEPGEEIRVCDGSIEPQLDDLQLRNAWRSHNHVGTLAEKIEGPVRAIAVDVAIEAGTIRYAVSEAVPHTFQRVTPTLAELDVHLEGRIDAEAGTFRLQFITDVPGQQATYLDKEQQARACLADPLGGPYPRIEREAARLGITAAAAAAAIVQTADTWRALDTLIDDRRLEAKEAVRAAATIEDKQAAAVVDWSALSAIAAAAIAEASAPAATVQVQAKGDGKNGQNRG
jgi:hypothetical protein